jgi:hypothetical protein
MRQRGTEEDKGRYEEGPEDRGVTEQRCKIELAMSQPEAEVVNHDLHPFTKNLLADWSLEKIIKEVITLSSEGSLQ